MSESLHGWTSETDDFHAAIRAASWLIFFMKILSAEFIKSAVRPEHYPADRRPQIAFAGRSNVGKSSLINALLNRRGLVKVSSTPGKTQTINFFLINNRFYFVDLPGYGYAKVPRAVLEAWPIMIEGYLEATRELKAVVVLMDSRRRPDRRDIRLKEWLGHYGIPAIYVLTKTDKLSRVELDKAVRDAEAVFGTERPIIPTSAETGMGLQDLWREVELRLES